MSTEQKLRLILSLNHLICRRTPGTADEIAKHLGISRSTFFRLLSYMKDELNAPIKYDEYRRSYFYDSSGEIVLGFITENNLKKHEMENLNGGLHFFSLNDASATSDPTYPVEMFSNVIETNFLLK